MPATAIAIPVRLRQAIETEALAAFPAECCGYLTGPRDGDGVDAIVPCRNAQEDGGSPIGDDRGADTGFVIAGAELIAFARSFDGERPARVVYHSHTNGRAYFSDVDQRMAAGPTYPVQHVVVGVVADRVIETVQFAWSDERGVHVEIARWQP